MVKSCKTCLRTPQGQYCKVSSRPHNSTVHNSIEYLFDTSEQVPSYSHFKVITHDHLLCPDMWVIWMLWISSEDVPSYTHSCITHWSLSDLGNFESRFMFWVCHICLVWSEKLVTCVKGLALLEIISCILSVWVKTYIETHQILLTQLLKLLKLLGHQKLSTSYSTPHLSEDCKYRHRILNKTYLQYLKT